MVTGLVATSTWCLAWFWSLMAVGGPDDPPAVKASPAVAPATKAEAPQTQTPTPAPTARPDLSKIPGLQGEDPPDPFVPRKPRTVEDRKWLDSLREYTAARSQEDRRQWAQAVQTLEKALKEQPDSIAIQRRLSRLCFALGRLAQGAKYGRQVVQNDPNDSVMIDRLFRYSMAQGDLNAAEELLRSVRDNPKMNKSSAGYLVVQRDLGRLHAGPLRKPEEAADAFAVLVKALDDKASNKLLPSEQRLILGSDPDDSYFLYGLVFLQTKRYDLAVTAFRRGLGYNPSNAQIPPRLAEGLFRAGQAEEALVTLDAFIKRQPQAREGYDLLGEILAKLGREKELLPRLEAAAKADSKNIALQFNLATAYERAGRAAEAKALYQKLLAVQPDPQGYSALASLLLSEKNYEELLRTLGAAVTKPNGYPAVKPQIDAIIADASVAQNVLERGKKLLANDPPTLDRGGQAVLVQIANRTKNTDTLIELLRLAFRRDSSNPEAYRELAFGLVEAGKYDEALKTLDEMMVKFPRSRTAGLIAALGEVRLLAGKTELALEAGREALKLEPNNPDVTRSVCLLFHKAGKSDEAIEMARDLLKRDSANADLHRLLGVILMQAGKEDDAVRHFKGLLEQFANDDDLVRLARSNLSVIYVNREDYSAGERELEILLDKYPDDIGVFNDLGYLWADQGKNLERAETMIRKAVEGDPENGAYLDSLGWVLFKRGKLKEAVEPLEKAAKLLGDTDPTITDHLGDIYFQLREYSKAKSSWETAVKTAQATKPPDKRLKEITKKLDALKVLQSTPNPKPASGENP